MFLKRIWIDICNVACVCVYETFVEFSVFSCIRYSVDITVLEKPAVASKFLSSEAGMQSSGSARPSRHITAYCYRSSDFSTYLILLNRPLDCSKASPRLITKYADCSLRKLYESPRGCLILIFFKPIWTHDHGINWNIQIKEGVWSSRRNCFPNEWCTYQQYLFQLNRWHYCINIEYTQ